MPTYPYECQACGHEFELSMLMSAYDHTIKPSCPSCKAENQTSRLFTPPMIQFVGDDWSTKNGRIATQMRKKNERLVSKENEQKKEGLVPTLVPNVDGERADSWSDAAKLAKSKGKDTSGYETRARKEKADT